MRVIFEEQFRSTLLTANIQNLNKTIIRKVTSGIENNSIAKTSS